MIYSVCLIGWLFVVGYGTGVVVYRIDPYFLVRGVFWMRICTWSWVPIDWYRSLMRAVLPVETPVTVPVYFWGVCLVRPWRGDQPDDLPGRKVGVIRLKGGSHTVRSTWYRGLVTGFEAIATPWVRHDWKHADSIACGSDQRSTVSDEYEPMVVANVPIQRSSTCSTSNYGGHVDNRRYISTRNFLVCCHPQYIRPMSSIDDWQQHCSFYNAWAHYPTN